MQDRIKVIIDTNLWINYLITKRLVDLDIVLQHKNVELVFAQELLEEFIEVAQRPRLRKYFSDADIQALYLTFYQIGNIYPIHSNIEICRDPKDNFLLALAQDAKADYLVSKDEDLLVLKQLGQTKILDYFAFKAELSARFESAP